MFSKKSKRSPLTVTLVNPPATEILECVKATQTLVKDLSTQTIFMREQLKIQAKALDEIRNLVRQIPKVGE